jgi:hypothetical protein
MNIGSLIDRMIAGGLSPGEAGSIAAEIYAAGVAAASTRSSGAERQRRYRKNHPDRAVTKRHETSQSDGDGGASQSVTSRHKASQSDAAYISSLDNTKEERKIDIPDRHALRLTLAADLEAKEIAQQRGLDVIEVAAIFLDFLEDKGRSATVSGFRNFLRKHNGPARAAAPQIGDQPSLEDFDRAAALFIKDNSKWGRGMGPEPGMGGCRCPPEILIKHGIDPKTGMRMQ